MELEMNVTVECEGRYRSGTKAIFDQIFGNYLPGDQDEIDRFRVFISRPSRPGEEGLIQRIDITDFLTEEQYSELYDAYLEECRNEK